MNILLTGASKGLGLKTTESLLKKGFTVFAISRSKTENLNELLIDFGSEYIQGLGTLAFAFGCQQYSFLAFESLDEPTESRWSIVAAMSLIVSFIL